MIHIEAFLYSFFLNNHEALIWTINELADLELFRTVFYSFPAISVVLICIQARLGVRFIFFLSVVCGISPLVWMFYVKGSLSSEVAVYIPAFGKNIHLLLGICLLFLAALMLVRFFCKNRKPGKKLRISNYFLCGILFFFGSYYSAVGAISPTTYEENPVVWYGWLSSRIFMFTLLPFSLCCYATYFYFDHNGKKPALVLSLTASLFLFWVGLQATLSGSEAILFMI